jgi:hypothetical protein
MNYGAHSSVNGQRWWAYLQFLVVWITWSTQNKDDLRIVELYRKIYGVRQH